MKVVMLLLSFLFPLAALSFAADATVVMDRSGCHDYFVADGTKGYYLLQWFGGYNPGVGDRMTGDLTSYGVKDVYYNGSESKKGKVQVEDFLLSKNSVMDKYQKKCSSPGPRERSTLLNRGTV